MADHHDGLLVAREITACLRALREVWDLPRPELVPDETLDRMERDGWTPTEVRQLVASYRQVARDAVELRQKPRGLSGRAQNALVHLRAACDTSSETAQVSVERLSTLLQEIGERDGQEGRNV